MEPTTPAGNDVVVTESGALIVIESACVSVRDPLSVTRTVKLGACAVVGVPVIAPAVDSVNPAGNVPAAILHVYGVVPPAAASVAE